MAKSYVQAKLFVEGDGVQTIRRDRANIYQLLIKILPPNSDDIILNINDELENLLAQFKNKNSVEEHEFSSMVLSNQLWERAGETAVKEFIYLDARQHAHFACPIISMESLEALEQSLKDDGSTVPQLKDEEAVAICAVASHLVGTPSLGIKERPQDKDNMLSKGTWQIIILAVLYVISHHLFILFSNIFSQLFLPFLPNYQPLYFQV